MRTSLLLPLLLLALAAAGQPRPGRGVWWPVLRLSSCCIVKPSGYSRFGAHSPQSDWYEQLSEQATTRQLVRLCGHYSPVVRYYAFRALCRRPDADLWPVVRHHVSDNVQVGTYFGCTRMRSYVSDLVIGAAYDTVAGGAPALSLAQRRLLDSLLVFHPRVRGFMRAVRLAAAQPPLAWHTRLRQLATRRGGAEVLPALARYHNPADVPILLKGLQQTYNDEAIQATEEYPAEDLYPALAQEFARRLAGADQQLCLAMSRYPRPATVRLFRQAFQDEDWKQAGYLLDLAVALRRHPHPLYADLLRELPLSEVDQQEVAERLKRLETEP